MVLSNCLSAKSPPVSPSVLTLTASQAVDTHQYNSVTYTVIFVDGFLSSVKEQLLCMLEGPGTFNPGPHQLQVTKGKGQWKTLD